MAAAVDTPVVLALDVTDPDVDDVDARVVTDLVPDHGVLILAVLTPPARASLNARLLAWRQAQRIDRADTLAARLRATASGRGITVSAVSQVPGTGFSALPRRVARVLARLCRDRGAGLLVLAAGPDAWLITECTRRHLRDTAPAGLRIRRIQDYAWPDARPMST
ncbi:MULTISPECIES: hypothetical protein [Nocardiaceae]|uniref:Universal stress protein family protein n=1 Tax=Rhodococcus triatomae TaxID=300028 RepID=A0A1G8S9Z4_9NOCA|nr:MULTISPECIES: hypothetical protein [Nocardiaceae]AVH20192.1 hypothetical protein C5B73_00690 [Nocardia cyriacigeorgica]MBF6138367.1 hypothetical protein [Nocardia otitidiscaviarum]MBF6485363.1 hypothetical protein [Nocardia otitidiscaviarum]PPJ13734.1 hypothetical protein C5E43_08980 [Nocardia cyriacigeorgica]QNG19015.1 hypothetical protein G4H72_10115 [Rhodococcus triatomae]